MDLDNKDLFMLITNHVVDFPSYFSNKTVYERMIDHTINYIKSCTGDVEIDKKNYLNDIFSMDFIKNRELSFYG